MNYSVGFLVLSFVCSSQGPLLDSAQHRSNPMPALRHVRFFGTCSVNKLYEIVLGLTALPNSSGKGPVLAAGKLGLARWSKVRYRSSGEVNLCWLYSRVCRTSGYASIILLGTSRFIKGNACSTSPEHQSQEQMVSARLTPAYAVAQCRESPE